jgi:hypothetical protein
MTILNAYMTLAEYKNWPAITSTDATDDSVLEKLIQAASRYIDNKTGRHFYPRINTRVYDIPDSAELRVKGDLLEVVTFTNGDDDTFSTTDYILLPANDYPKHTIKLRNLASAWWELDTNYGDQQVIDVAAVWGYHNLYDERAWSVGGTLGAAMTTTTDTAVTLASSHACVTGQIWRIDNEILNGSISTNTLTAIVRGDNGSTAATHVIGTTVYFWNPQDDIKEAAIMLVASLDKRRAGDSISSETIATAAGVLITPRDVPGFTADVINTYKRRS